MESGSSGLRKRGGGDSVDDLLAMLEEAATRRGATRDPWAQLDAYLEDLGARNGARHLKTTKQQLQALRRACPSLTIGEVYAWRGAALRDGKSKATVNHYIGRAQTYLRWKAAVCDEAPHPLTSKKHLMAVVPKDRKRKPRAMDDDEIARFFEAAAALDKELGGVPQAMNWRFMLESGVRWKEAAQLRVEHVVGDVVELPASFTKRGKERFIGPLPEDAARWIAARPKSEPLMLAREGKSWLEVGHRVSHRCFVVVRTRADLPPLDLRGRLLTIHSLRYTCGTRWLRAGVPIADVSRMLGHGSTSFTERVYIDLKLGDPVASARRALAAAKKKSEESAKPAEEQ